ncbi:hypothetical protein GGR56DRAFT_139365 [Xylariaceae sp. FL0804]|nr:hypothetical protein GGR56DRAFT_139365 [Xylariaceae sp. FL0804]
MARIFPSLLLGALAIAGQAAAGCIPRPYFDWDDTKYLIAFGDSYTYVQGTAGRQNYSFIGDFLPGDLGFAPARLLADRIVQNFTGTAEGGPNWAEFLTRCGLGAPGSETAPRDCSSGDDRDGGGVGRQLWDFAFAGADVSSALLPLHHAWTVPLVNQTRQYLTWAEPALVGRLRMDKSRALVAVWIGINDINDSADMASGGAAALRGFYDEEIAAVFEQAVRPLFGAGYANFLFVNLPPLDRTPPNAGRADPSPNRTMIGWWDDALARHSRDFAARNPSATTMVYDANAFLNGVLDNAGKYGIKNTTSYCPAYDVLDVQTDPGKYGCLPLDQYFWYNTGHMTSHVHQVLAPDIDRFLREQSTTPRH